MNFCSRAVKIVKKCDLESGERAKLLEEIEILVKLDHPNIGQVLEMYEDQDRLYFVSEIMDGGSLFEKLKSNTHLPEYSAASIIRQLLSATAYLHA
jgi:serine/threonine protein kinase